MPRSPHAHSTLELIRPSFGATVDHRAGACGSAQQRRDQLHVARAASAAGPDLQAVSTGADCAPREIGRPRTPVLHRPSLRAAAREAVLEARRNPCRQPLPNLPVWAGLRRAWSQAVAPASLGAAGCVGRGGPRRRSVAGSRLRNGRGAAGLFASLSPARKAPRAQLEREAVRSAGTPGASCASRRRARDVEAVRPRRARANRVGRSRRGSAAVNPAGALAAAQPLSVLQPLGGKLRVDTVSK